MSNYTRYNNLHNEGEEGYNPYDRRAAESAEPRWSVLSGQRSRILRIMEGISISDPRYAEYEAQLAKIEAEIKIENEKEEKK